MTNKPDPKAVEAKTDGHEHKWERSPMVIDTYPATEIWSCNCGYISHNGGKTIAKCCGRGAREELS